MNAVPKSSRFARERAFNVLELMVILAAVVIMVGLLLPALARPRKAAVRVNCVNNLKQVAIAFRIWAGDNNGAYPMKFYTNESGAPKFADANGAFHYFEVMSNELSMPKILVCSQDTQRHAATNFLSDLSNAKVSYFIGLDADEANPNMFLAGDRHLTNNSAMKNGMLGFATNQPAWWTKDRHGGNGNIALTDGSVAPLTSGAATRMLIDTGRATNWLLFP